jgi:hypothetical protein
MLAARLDKTLAGLVLEDQRLFSGVELPFVHEISLTGHRCAPIDTGSLNRDMQREARKLRLELEMLDKRAPFRWSLEVRRGAPADLLAAAINPGDLVVLHRPLMTDISASQEHSILVLDARTANLPHAITALADRTAISEAMRRKIRALSHLLGDVAVTWLNPAGNVDKAMVIGGQTGKNCLVITEQAQFEKFPAGLRRRLMSGRCPLLLL